MKGEGKVVLEVLLDYDEALQLQGNMNNVHIFSEDVQDGVSSVTSRGTQASTKYFLVPRNLRKNLNFKGETTCQKIEMKDKVFFIYTMEKF